MEGGRTWALKISGLDPPEVRPHHVVQDMERMPPQLAVELLVDILENLVRGEEHAGQFMMALQEALTQGRVPYDRLTIIYQAAVDLGAESVQLLLLAPHAKKKHVAPPTPQRAEGNDTLGMRTWKARTATGHALDRLLMDVEPAVVRNLLINPRLTEKDVLRMVNRRPVPPQVLVEVALHTRWNRRFEVQRALVFNPYTPTELALRFLPFMRTQDLRHLASDGTVHLLVARQADDFVRIRPPGEDRTPQDEAMNDDRER